MESWLTSWEHCLLLQKTQILFPAPTQWFTMVSYLSSRESHTLFWLPLALHASGGHTNRQVLKYINKKKNIDVFIDIKWKSVNLCLKVLMS